MRLKDRLDSGDFAILAEMEPPKGADASRMVNMATRVKGAVDAFLVPEMSNAVMRMSSLGGALILQQRGLEAIVQANCRDRNRLALQADLLAAYACGITNVMVVAGDDPSVGDHHQTKPVYDIDLHQLLDTIQQLQNGHDLSGIELYGAPHFLVGATVSPTVKEYHLDKEIQEMENKRNHGVNFFITPPVFDLSAIRPFLNAIDTSKTYIIPTVLLLKSAGMARYMDRNMDHIKIPREVINRIQKAGDKTRECVLIAKEIVATLKRENFCGVCISTIGWEDKLPEILGTISG
jgi:5,10-methylenetetrahydrofolate reductase